MSDLLKLAAQCEAATGPDRHLDYLVMASTIPTGLAHLWDPGDQRHRYTASLDAAMTLVPCEAFWRLGHDGDGADPSEYRAQIIVPILGGKDAQGIAIAMEPELALTAAALRARDAQGIAARSDKTGTGLAVGKSPVGDSPCAENPSDLSSRDTNNVG